MDQFANNTCLYKVISPRQELDDNDDDEIFCRVKLFLMPNPTTLTKDSGGIRRRPVVGSIFSSLAKETSGRNHAQIT